jgi:molybdate transport system substrate-binding protein
MTLSMHSPANATLFMGGSDSTLTVFAASSLRETFVTLGNQFEKKHPRVKIQFSFLSSGVLATQILSGAPADVFASASEADMALAKPRVPISTIFAANRVILAFPKSSNFRINTLMDLNQKGLKWIQCSHSAPCGAAADASLSSFGKVLSRPVSFEPNVASVVAKLVSGEVDAAIIYHSDYVAHKKLLNEIRFPDISASTTRYPIGVIKGSKNSELAQSFVSSILSAQGKKVFAEAGFARVG